MKKKNIILMTLFFIIILFGFNDKVYADDYCDKLAENKNFTKLCRYYYLDSELPMYANLYISNDDTMIEWKCDLRIKNSSVKSAKGICDENTTQTIRFSEGEKTIKNGGAFFGLVKDEYHFYNYIESNNCPSYIYYYFASKGGALGKVNYYHKWTTSMDNSYNVDGLLTTGYWTTLVLSKDCSDENEDSVVEPVTKISCDLIDQDIIDMINEVMNYIRIGVPILLLCLIIVDFSSAIFASSEDKMKKAQSKVIKRIIIAIVIFFVPTLLNFVFDIVNDVWEDANYEICGLDE